MKLFGFSVGFLELSRLFSGLLGFVQVFQLAFRIVRVSVGILDSSGYIGPFQSQFVFFAYLILFHASDRKWKKLGKQ